ncbi:MAG: hypothetical protein J7549_05840 [Variovorax sp.]|nr:hypothetical protein [Variovorax sp.]
MRIGLAGPGAISAGAAGGCTTLGATDIGALANGGIAAPARSASRRTGAGGATRFVNSVTSGLTIREKAPKEQQASMVSDDPRNFGQLSEDGD